jgi:phage tail sheath protein FI
MAFQLSPGVLVTEEDKSTVVPAVATSAGAFSGAFQWGPVEKVTTVDTERNLVEQFGNPNDDTAGYFFTAANFLSYGNNLKLVRVADKSVARNAVTTPSGRVSGVTITNTPNTFASAADITVTFAAAPAGGTRALGNAVLSTTGVVNSINLTTGGAGYSATPTVTVSGGGGSGATAIAVLTSGGIGAINVQDGGNNYNSLSNVVIQNQQSTSASANLVIHFKLEDIQISNPGSNFGPAGTACNITISGGVIVPGGVQATANPIITGNIITGYTITNNGNGYLAAPNIVLNRLDGNTGTSAVLTANLGYGIIDSINIINIGAGGYNFTPNVTINKNNLLGGATANATARIEAIVGSITVTNSGSGFTSTPNVIITPVLGDSAFISSNANPIAVVGFTLNSITITRNGTGYTSVPAVTIVDSQNRTATANATLSFDALLIENSDVYDSEYSTGGFGYGEFIAKYPGTLGNSLKVSVADSNTFTGWQYANQFNSAPSTSAWVSARNGSADELHVIVVDANGDWTGTAGTILEKFSYVSKASDAKNSDNSTNYYKDVINNQSRYISWLDHPTAGTNWGTTGSAKAFATLSANITTTLSGGVTGSSVSAANIQAGYELFSNDELYDVSLIPMGPTTNVGVVNTVIGIAESRRDCVVFVSPPYTDVVNTTNQASKIAAYRDTLTSSSFAVLDSGWKYQYDRYNDKYRYVPLNGDVAGLAARTDYIADPWFSPAGYNRGVIKNVVKLAFSPTKTDRDDLYKKGINPVVTFPGQGTLLFGDKTLLARPSAFDRINVRRLFIVLEKAISTASKFQLFEFNDPFTRAQFRNLVEPFLRDVQGRRGITDFRVICDDTNNPGSVVDRNEFVADIFIKPARAINFIQLNFVATRSGVSFEEVGA